MVDPKLTRTELRLDPYPIWMTYLPGLILVCFDYLASRLNTLRFKHHKHDCWIHRRFQHLVKKPTLKSNAGMCLVVLKTIFLENHFPGVFGENHFREKWFSYFTVFGKIRSVNLFSLESRKLFSFWMEHKLILRFFGAHTVSHSFSLPYLFPRHIVRRLSQWHIVRKLR